VKLKGREMRSWPPAALWIAFSFGAALALAALTLTALGSSERGTGVALQLTARLSFLLFLPAYAGGAVTSLFGPAFQILKRYGREFGLAFASAHLVHLGLVAWLSYIGAAPPLNSFVFFGVAALLTYLLAAFSIERLRKKLGDFSWWSLSAIGLNYIAFAFAVDFLRYPLNSDIKHLAGYTPFAILSILAPLVRAAAFLQRIFGLQRDSVKRSR
jgi:hypothetical protein